MFASATSRAWHREVNHVRLRKTPGGEACSPPPQGHFAPSSDTL